MIARRFRRLAVPLVVGVIAFGLAACSNTASDAATITYHDGSGTHTTHISRADFKKQLGELVGSTQFQRASMGDILAVAEREMRVQ